MVSAVAFVPQAPLLIPALTGGSSPELDELRAACRVAIRDVAAPGRQLVLVGPGAVNATYPRSARGSLTAFGGPGTDDPTTTADLPTSLSVGVRLVRDAIGPSPDTVLLSVDAGAPGLDAAPDDGCALVVLGDGSACRTLKAPGYLDERAAPFDAAIADALRQGDAAALDVAADAERGAVLQAAGVPAWRAAGRLLEGQSWDAELHYDAAPFGVGYFVAVWHRRD